jgi:hypothetical protein
VIAGNLRSIKWTSTAKSDQVVHDLLESCIERDLGPWGITNWMNDVIKQFPDPVAQIRLLADLNALLRLQGRNPLSRQTIKSEFRTKRAYSRLSRRKSIGKLAKRLNKRLTLCEPKVRLTQTSRWLTPRALKPRIRRERRL